MENNDTQIKEARYWLEKGIEFFNSGNYEEAITCYEKIIDLKLEGNVFLNSGNYEETVTNSEKIIASKLVYAYAYNYFGLALVELGKLNKDETLYNGAFIKYEKATQLNPAYSDAFFNWGNALYNLAKIKQDENLFQQSFEKYTEAVENHTESTTLNPLYTMFSYLWRAIAELVKIKQDDILFKESFEKYNEATELDSNFYSFFFIWGDVLAELAKNNKDENLYRKCFEKYAKAAQLNPEFYGTFNNWGIALSELAKIKKDNELYNESFKKFKTADKLNPNDTYTLNNWGTSLYDCAKIKKDENLFKNAIEKYEKVILNPIVILDTFDIRDIFIDLGATFYNLYSITQDEKYKTKATDYFEKSNKDILEILVFLDEDDSEDIVQKDILFSLLDLDNNDGNFFRKTIKNENDIYKLEKYKKTYILSMFIISKLYVNVNNENEKLVAHYSQKTVVQKLLFDNNKFRLNAINYSNDNTEGIILLDYLINKNTNYHLKKIKSTEYVAFAGCFTFNYDSLNQFRLYGKEDDKEGTGLSLVFRKSFFRENPKMALSSEQTDRTEKDVLKKYALFRCIYIDPITQRVETVGHKEDYLFYRENKNKKTDGNIERKTEEYHKYIAGVIKKVRENINILQDLIKDLDSEIVGQLLINLRYLTKHIAFKEEHECRIVKIHNLKDNKEIKTTPDFKQMYIEYPPKVSNYIAKIYFGPKATGMELFQDILIYKGLGIICEKSENPLV